MAKARASRAPERPNPGVSLCQQCLWDCEQPLGVTVVCPYWQKRGADEPRQRRTGQLNFGFEGSSKHREAQSEPGSAPQAGVRHHHASRDAADPYDQGLFSERQRRSTGNR